MRYGRVRNGRNKKAKRFANLLLYAGITLALSFCIKYLLFDEKEPAHASMENVVSVSKNMPGKVTDSQNNSDSPPAERQEENIDQTIDKDGTVNQILDKDQVVDGNVETDDEIGKDINTPESDNKPEEEVSIENCVFIGDSITEALSYYKVVSPSNVVANKGYTAKKALSDVDKVVKLNPDKIFIMLGLNDILTERNTDKYIENYTMLVEELNKDLPEAEIYVQSILPVDSSIQNSKLNISNSEIEKFNRELKAFAAQKNLPYLDIASVVKNYDENLREPDGIHYKAKFCNVWLQYIKENI